MGRRSLKKLDTIVIHCALTPNGRSTSIEEIDGWHAARGFQRDEEARRRAQPALAAVGYHRVIYLSGVVVHGRELEETGAHCKRANAHSIGICLIGTDKFTASQWESLRAEVERLTEEVRRAGGKIVRIVGHRDLDPIADGVPPRVCPGFEVSRWLSGGMEPLPGHIL